MGDDTPPPAPPVDSPPDRLCIARTSSFYDAKAVVRGVGVRFKGVEKANVYEYCVNERWVRVIPPNQRGMKNPTTVKLQGDVEVYFRRPAK